MSPIDTQNFMPPGLPLASGVQGAPDARAAEGAVGKSAVTLDSAKLVGLTHDKGAALEKLGLPQPQGGFDPQAVGGAADALKALGESAPADIYAMMALFAKISQEQRNAARMDRQTSLQAQETALRGAADKIKQAAEERFKGALAQGICQIAAGSFSVAMGGVSMGAGITSASTGAAASRANTGAFDAAKASGRSTAYAQMAGQKASAGLTQSAQTAGTIGNSANLLGQGGGQIIGGIGTIVQATYERKAAEHDAERANLEADAKVAESGVQAANDIMQQMMQVINDIRDKLASIEQSRIETNRGIARNV